MYINMGEAAEEYKTAKHYRVIRDEDGKVLQNGCHVA